jgi:uncharacterized protein involved in exopolysaccharide biosynthesis
MTSLTRADTGLDTLLQSALPAARREWRLLLGATLAGALVGLIAALVLPKWYATRSSFQPESQAPSALSAGLAGIASQLAAGALGGQANPQFYADLIRSDVVIRRVASQSYAGPHGLEPLAVIYRISDPSGEKRIQRTMTKLRDGVSTDVNIRTGVVTFTARGRTPEMAKAIGDSILAAVNDFNINIRQSRARAEHVFAEGRAAAAAHDLLVAENALADFNARNRVITSPLLQTQGDRLRRAADVASQVYLQLKLQAEQAAVQQVRDTPALTVIDPPTLPVRPSSPRKPVTMFGTALAALLAAIAYLLYTNGLFSSESRRDSAPATIAISR